ncbi:FUSC family protein [Caballeronia telluris]|nr:FUSC family protein [Caballeronia telluris]
MPSLDTPTSRRSRARRMLHVLASPYFRYRHAKLLHALRVSLAMLASIALTSGIDIPHGVWASVTLLVVIGGLQHHGNIRKKAAERALGTLLGASFGLTLIIVQSVLGSLMLTFLLMSAIAGACAYYAIGKAGYVALLTAITMVIVAGHGDLPIDVGLWRTANVLIGIVIALGFSFVLPLYATYSWRYRLADNMRECARLYAAIIEGRPIDPDELTQRFLVMSRRLVQSRSLMESVAKEIDVPVAALDEIQRLHRSILAALEMLASSGPLDAHMAPDEQAACTAEERAVRQTLLLMARALRFGRVGLLHAAAYTLDVKPGMDAAHTDPDAHGMHWLAMRLAEQVNRLRLRLIEIERHWNIEGAQPFFR